MFFYSGEILLFNNTIQLIDVSNIYLTRGNSAVGLHSFSLALKTNRSLHTLILRNNHITEDQVCPLLDRLILCLLPCHYAMMM